MEVSLNSTLRASIIKGQACLALLARNLSLRHSKIELNQLLKLPSTKLVKSEECQKKTLFKKISWVKFYFKGFQIFQPNFIYRRITSIMHTLPSKRP